MKILFPILLAICLPFFTMGQQKDTAVVFNKTVEACKKKSTCHFICQSGNNPPAISFILPATLITYGFIGLKDHEIKEINTNTKSELQEDHPKFLTKIDNYLQYSPAVAVYALNALGIKGKNNFRDRTMIYVLSTVISSATVLSLKNICKVERPDGSGNNSFPSGHTTTAFAAAEFLRMEYKDVSPWYGIAGYITATATGVLRLYNNKHWVNDIVAGAGFGILSTKLAYWIYPSIKRIFFKDRPVKTMLMPFYQSGNAGFSLVHNF